MPDVPSPPEGSAPPAGLRLLRRAAWGSAVALVVVVGWMSWEAVQRPDIGASMYGKGRNFTSVYWGPFIAFCAVGLGLATYVFARAFRRLSRGEWTPGTSSVGRPSRRGDGHGAS